MTQHATLLHLQKFSLLLFNGTFAEEWGPDEQRCCKLTFIGKNLDKKAITDAFLRCECDEEVRKETLGVFSVQDAHL